MQFTCHLSNESKLTILFTGASFGLGHIIPVGGRPYRFNNTGMFWIIRDEQFSMQGETAEVKNINGM